MRVAHSDGPLTGSREGSCKHCGAPVYRHDERETLGHREPVCRKFYACSQEALSYQHALVCNFNSLPAVQS